MRQWTALLVLGLVASAVCVAQEAVPTPSPVPVSWALDARFEPIESIQVPLPGQAQPRTFWYLRYTVANATGDDRMFIPNFLLYTDTGAVMRAGENVPLAVFSAIQKRHNAPLLHDAGAMAGKLLQGQDNAKDGVAIWADIPADARAFDVFVGGLSGETQKIALPVPVPADGSATTSTAPAAPRTEAVLRKTLQRSYVLPGEPEARANARPKLMAQKWVMR